MTLTGSRIEAGHASADDDRRRATADAAIDGKDERSGGLPVQPESGADVISGVVDFGCQAGRRCGGGAGRGEGGEQEDERRKAPARDGNS